MISKFLRQIFFFIVPFNNTISLALLFTTSSSIYVFISLILWLLLWLYDYDDYCYCFMTNDYQWEFEILHTPWFFCGLHSLTNKTYIYWYETVLSELSALIERFLYFFQFSDLFPNYSFVFLFWGLWWEEGGGRHCLHLWRLWEGSWGCAMNCFGAVVNLLTWLIQR